MIKLLITSALIYFIYRFFIAAPAIDGNEHHSDSHVNEGQKQQASSHDDEYIDYEEVD
ncbi:MAG: hypothetical protein AAFY48_04650 [Bacteroidota bacterium]